MIVELVEVAEELISLVILGSNNGGKGGTLTSGGDACHDVASTNGGRGTFGHGGNQPTSYGDNVGYGGGGYYGGGAGDGGGGGGSGYANTSKLNDILGNTGVQSGNGKAQISPVN